MCTFGLSFNCWEAYKYSFRVSFIGGFTVYLPPSLTPSLPPSFTHSIPHSLPPFLPHPLPFSQNIGFQPSQYKVCSATVVLHFVRSYSYVGHFCLLLRKRPLLLALPPPLLPSTNLLAQLLYIPACLAITPTFPGVRSAKPRREILSNGCTLS